MGYDLDDDALLASNPFWYCLRCGSQNSRLDGECQWCEPEDHTDDPCPCGEPECSRPFGHSEEGGAA